MEYKKLIVGGLLIGCSILGGCVKPTSPEKVSPTLIPEVTTQAAIQTQKGTWNTFAINKQIDKYTGISGINTEDFVYQKGKKNMKSTEEIRKAFASVWTMKETEKKVDYDALLLISYTFTYDDGSFEILNFYAGGLGAYSNSDGTEESFAWKSEVVDTDGCIQKGKTLSGF